MRLVKYQVYDHKQKMMFDVIEISRLEHSSGYVKGRKGDSGGEYFVTEGYLSKKYQLPEGKQIYRFDLREYTGLKDRNGKEIYEGDMWQARPHGRPYVIKWNKYRWFLYNPRIQMFWAEADEELKHGEVIGNIYELPHLLESVK